jgi:hypothetical protein
MSILNYRRYARVQVEIPIKFIPKNSAEAVSAYLNNISEEGASLICPFAVPVAMTLEFDVTLTPSLPPVHIQSEVLWSRPIKDDGRDMFAHGLLLQKLTVADRQRLHDYISGTMSY